MKMLIINKNAEVQLDIALLGFWVAGFVVVELFLPVLLLSELVSLAVKNVFSVELVVMSISFVKIV